ncbi:GATOR complex protein NPRL2 [Nymphon striatum]|nr:GATOR complex protein NPRL2 [Nymphon striatum]
MFKLSNTPESKIKAILFCEFHHQYGPKITYQVPEKYISKEDFDILSVYIITKRELQKKLITVNALGYKILGYPVNIDNKKYARNALIFNMCFICDASKRTIQYEPLIRKLSEYLTTLELESGFLSNEESKKRLPNIMDQILNNLNSYGVCTVPIDDSNTIHLKVIKTLKDPVEVEDFHVPVLLISKSTLVNTNPDLTTLQVLPHIDGFKQIGRIAAEAEVEISLVKACIQNLTYYGATCIIPIFQYSNMYTVLSELQRLAQDSEMQTDCVRYVAKYCDRLPTFKDAFVMYCNLIPGKTVRDLCIRFNPHSLGIDERKLVQYGLIHGLIRRVQKYPVLLTSSVDEVKREDGPTQYFTGHCSVDEICSKTGLSYQELDRYIEGDPNVVACWK